MSLINAILELNGKPLLDEGFEVYALGDNGERARIPTTDTNGASKYSDAAQAAMQKSKLEKQSPGKHWTVVSVADPDGKKTQPNLPIQKSKVQD
jgi:hypothetical protein